MRWRLVPGQTLLRHDLDGEYAIYNNLTGDTHVLPDDAVQLLLALRAAPAQPEALLALLAPLAADAEPEPDPAQAILLMLEELAALDLVEQTAC